MSEEKQAKTKEQAAAKAAKPEQVKAEPKKAYQGVKYPVAELIEAYKTFGVPKEVAVVALRNISEATEEEARDMITAFCKKGVK